MVKGYNSTEDVIKGIEQLEYKQKTTSFKSAGEENKVLKEIDTLKASIPKVKRFSEIQPRCKVLYDEKQNVWKELKVVKAELGKHEEAVEAHRSEMARIQDEKSDVKDQASAISTDIE